jgi:hypothetical protein
MLSLSAYSCREAFLINYIIKKLEKCKKWPENGLEKCQTVDANLNEEITGVHDLYFLFKGNQGAKLFNFDWWQFK